MAELDRLNKRVHELKNKIYNLNLREEAEISESEIRKIQKVKSKLLKECNKVMKKIEKIFLEE